MSAEKTLSILDLFSYKNNELNVFQISEMLNLPQSSIYRYVSLLRKKDLLIETKEGYYSLGYKFLKYYRIVKNNTNLNLISEKVMKSLTEKFDEVVMLLVYSNLQAVCLATTNSESAVKLVSEPGEIVPLYAGGSSKALLAFLDDDIVEELYKNIGIIKYTEKTITNLSDMKKELSQIREKGYATSTGELYEAVTGFGVPVFNSDKEIVASLSLSGLDYKMKNLNEQYIVEELTDASREIQKYL